MIPDSGCFKKPYSAPEPQVRHRETSLPIGENSKLQPSPDKNLGEESLLRNASLFVMTNCDWFHGKTRITNNGKISKYGTIFLTVFSAGNMYYINNMAATVQERRIAQEVIFVKVMHDFPCKPSFDITQYFIVIAKP